MNRSEIDRLVRVGNKAKSHNSDEGYTLANAVFVLVINPRWIIEILEDNDLIPEWITKDEEGVCGMDEVYYDYAMVSAHSSEEGLAIPAPLLHTQAAIAFYKAVVLRDNVYHPEIIEELEMEKEAQADRKVEPEAPQLDDLWKEVAMYKKEIVEAAKNCLVDEARDKVFAEVERRFR